MRRSSHSTSAATVFAALNAGLAPRRTGSAAVQSWRLRLRAHTEISYTEIRGGGGVPDGHAGLFSDDFELGHALRWSDETP